MIRITLPILFFASLFSGSSSGEIVSTEPDPAFTHLLTCFKKTTLPYESGKIKPVRIFGPDSAYLKNNLQKKMIIAITDTSADTWDDADEEGKNRLDFPEHIGAGAIMQPYKDIYLLEIIDLHSMKGDSIPVEHGIFLPKTTYLFTFDKSGKPISGVVVYFSSGNEHGSVNRWSCNVKSPGEIIIKEYGSRTEEKYTYSFTSTCKINPDGKIVKLKSSNHGK
jgi:hypothetical protein